MREMRFRRSSVFIHYFFIDTSSYWEASVALVLARHQRNLGMSDKRMVSVSKRI